MIIPDKTFNTKQAVGWLDGTLRRLATLLQSDMLASVSLRYAKLASLPQLGFLSKRLAKLNKLAKPNDIYQNGIRMTGKQTQTQTRLLLITEND